MSERRKWKRRRRVKKKKKIRIEINGRMKVVGAR